MNCSGIETFSGTAVQVTFDETISAVEPVSQSAGLYLSPGFIDLQVNGFLGVDFNDPKCTMEQIARSIRGLFATGVTRFYPPSSPARRTICWAHCATSQFDGARIVQVCAEARPVNRNARMTGLVMPIQMHI
jgi:N-acetylglucosamine-6-phosphate deacetylase